MMVIKKRSLLTGKDPVLYRIMTYLSVILVIVGWLFFYFYKNKMKKYTGDLLVPWEEIVIKMMSVLELLGWIMTIYSIIMLLFKSRKMLRFSPVIFSAIIIVLLAIPSFLNTALIYGFIMDEVRIFFMLLLTVSPIIFILFYLNKPILMLLIMGALSTLTILLFPFIISDTLKMNLTEYKPYALLLSSNLMFYFSMLIAFFIIKEFRKIEKTNNLLDRNL